MVGDPMVRDLQSRTALCGFVTRLTHVRLPIDGCNRHRSPDGPGSDGPGFAIPDPSLRVCNPPNPRKATNQWL